MNEKELDERIEAITGKIRPLSGNGVKQDQIKQLLKDVLQEVSLNEDTSTWDKVAKDTYESAKYEIETKQNKLGL